MSYGQDLDRLLREKLTNEYRKGYIDLKGYCLPDRFTEIANAVENMEVRDTDIWVCSFPKAGTMWAQEMVWCIDNDLDFEGAKVVVSKRFPFLEATAMCYRFTTSDEMPKDHYQKGSMVKFNFKQELVNSVGFIDTLSNPRYIRTHLPFELLPREIRTGERKPKIIYVTRNPKDTCISYYHHCRRMLFDKINFEEFCALFYAGKVSFGSYWDHVSSYWNQRNRKNLLILQFEDLITDLPSVIRKTADFLGKKIAEDDIKDLIEHLSFENMRMNPAVNHEEVIEPFTKNCAAKIDTNFMRCGQIGQWEGFMSTNFIEKFNKLTEEKLKDIDFHC